MLYSSKKEIHTSVEHTGLEPDERGDQGEDTEGAVSSPGEQEQRKLDPLESLDEPTRICFLVSSGAVVWTVEGLHRMDSFWLAPGFCLCAKMPLSDVLGDHFLKTQLELCRIGPEGWRSP